MKKLRILIADDHALVRRGAREVLHSRNDWRVVGEAANGREAVQKAIELKPDVAVVDIGMPYLDGVEVTLRIRKPFPIPKFLFSRCTSQTTWYAAHLTPGQAGTF